MKRRVFSIKVLVVGPSDTRSQGGMATVINGIRNSRVLNDRYDIDIFESYIDGSLPVRLLYSLHAFLKFLLVYRKYDLFHIHAASFGSTFRKRLYLKVVKRAKKKAIVHVHGAAYMVFYEGLNEKKKRTVVDFLKSADMVIGLSDDWKEKFEKTFGLTNCVSLPNGIDVEEFSEAVCPPEAHINSFLLLGRLGERKGAYDLISAVETAVKTNPELHVVLAGDGEIDKVKSLIAQKKLESHIDVPGWVDSKGKIEFLKKCSTVVLPSYNEGLPMSVLEGMASGKAIISTTVGAIPEVIKPENGILITPGDVEALAEALVKLSTDVETVRRMSKANIEKIDAMFSMKRMHEKLSEYYDRAAGVERAV